jgi:cytochrome c
MVRWRVCLLVVAIGAGAVGSRVAAAQVKTVWDGVFTEAQATRGEAVYFEECASCHSRDLAGGDGSPAPPLAGDLFLERLADSSVADFVERVRTTMPLDSPARLSRTQYVEIVAFILKANRIPAGADELGTDPEALGRIAITKRPAGK